MKQTILSLAMLLGICFLASCKSNSTNAPADLAGDLTGRVSLMDSKGNTVSDRSGVTVQAEGTAFSATTDTAGYWTITNLPGGTYSISFSKPTYNTWKNTAYQFVGGGLTWFGVNFPNNGSELTLIQSPTYTITLDSIQLAGSAHLEQYDSLGYIYRYDTLKINGDSYKRGKM